MHSSKSFIGVAHWHPHYISYANKFWSVVVLVLVIITLGGLSQKNSHTTQRDAEIVTDPYFWGVNEIIYLTAL